MLIWALDKIPDLQPFTILIITFEPDIRLASFLFRFTGDSESYNWYEDKKSRFGLEGGQNWSLVQMYFLGILLGLNFSVFNYFSFWAELVGPYLFVN